MRVNSEECRGVGVGYMLYEKHETRQRPLKCNNNALMKKQVKYLCFWQAVGTILLDEGPMLDVMLLCCSLHSSPTSPVAVK